MDSGCSYTFVMIRPKQITPKEDSVEKFHTQAGIIITNKKVKIYFTLPELSETKS